MKQIWKFAFAAAAVLAVAACNTKEPAAPEAEKPLPGADGKYSYVLSVGGDTKTIISSDHIAWEAGDYVGWFTDIEGASEVDITKTPRSFTIKSNTALSEGATVYAYAPYKTDGQSKTAVALSIPAEQDQTGALYDADAMPLVAVPLTLSSTLAAGTDTPVGEIHFLNLGSIVQYNVYSSEAAYASENIKSVSFKASSALAGDFTYDITAVTGGSVPAITGLSSDEVVTKLNEAVGASKAEAVAVYQVVAPGSYTGTVTVATDKAEYTFTFDVAKDFARAAIKPLEVDLANGTRTAKLTSPYKHTFASGDFGTGSDRIYYASLTNPDNLSGANWTIGEVAGGYKWEVVNEKWAYGIRVNDKTHSISNLVLKTSSIPGAITKVTLGYNASEDYSLTVACSIGGAPFGKTLTHKSGDYQAVFTGEASGEIALTFNSDGNACFYLQSIQIEFDPDRTVSMDDIVAKAELETALTAYDWVLASVLHDGSDVSHGAGNKMHLESDYTFSFDCSSHEGKTYDYYYEGGWIAPDFSNWGEGSYWDGSEKWSALVSSGVKYLKFSKKAYPLVVVDQVIKNELSYEVTTISSSALSLSYGSYVINFTATERSSGGGETTEGQYDHLLVSGDFGATTEWTAKDTWEGTLSDKEWTMTLSPSGYGANFRSTWAGTVLWVGASGWGSGAETITLRSSSFSGTTISNISVDVSMSGGLSISASATVGGVAFGTTIEAANLDESNPTPTISFTGSASGTIVITITTNKAQPLFLRGLHVTYGGTASDL